MAHLNTVLLLGRGDHARRVRLADYLDAQGDEDAARRANAWIKSLRHARVDSVSFRERFTYRDDSLWWFAELYLHKERTVLSLFRTSVALTSFLDREAPAALRIESGDIVTQLVARALAHKRRIAFEGGNARRSSLHRRVAMDARSTGLLLAAFASPGRPSRIPRLGKATVAAFVHRAFWRNAGTESSAEAYIGPVLSVLQARLPPAGLQHVGVGPTTNFRARRWWRRRSTASRVIPIEHLTPRTSLAPSTGLWAARHAMLRALLRSADLRQASVIDGCDCWTIVSDALAGIALLQFPWSARAMDEAGAALDGLSPVVALTYAEAGGWGRALALEARRRRIPLVGLQHGFIYRHWLNYLHEADEMRPVGAASRDAGFPLPTRTLVFDEYAFAHLVGAGRFPPETLAVTGSPRLDALAADFRRLSEDDVAAARESCAAAPSKALVLLVTKFSEVAGILPALLRAVRSVPEVQLAIKTHPAETPDPYERAAAGQQNVRVLPASAPLAPLLRASQAVVTVNSTVALDAMALGIPALTIGLPNNLSPFVESGAIAGAAGADDIAAALSRVLYDQVFRRKFSETSAAVAERFRMLPGESAADTQASIILGLAGHDT